MRDIRVITSAALPDATKKKVEAFFFKKLNAKELRFVYETDPSILGGIKVIDGNNVYDGTLADQLERLKRSLL